MGKAHLALSGMPVVSMTNTVERKIAAEHGPVGPNTIQVIANHNPSVSDTRQSMILHELGHHLHECDGNPHVDQVIEGSLPVSLRLEGAAHQVDALGVF